MKENKDITNFSVPSGYFENFENNLLVKLQEDKFPKRISFKVPQKYFETLDARILSQISPSKKNVKIIKLNPWKYAAYIASVAAILVVGFITSKNPEISGGLDKIDIASIDTYINEGRLDLNIYEVYEVLENDDLSQALISEVEFSDAMLEDYLLDNID